MEYSNEAVELLENVLSDIANKHKFVRNANKLNNTGLKIEKKYGMDPDSPNVGKVLDKMSDKDQEKFSKYVDKKLGKMQKYASNTLQAETDLRKNPKNANWLDTKAEDIHNKYTDRRNKAMNKKNAQHEAALILIEALNTLLSE